MEEKVTGVRKRLEWAQADNDAAISKLLTLISGLPIDRALWEEITCHMALTISHMTNAQRLLGNENQ